MAAPKGNQFWMLRSKHGRDKLFATPEALWEAACEYFQWCDENPWTTRKAIQRTMPVRRKKGKRTENTTRSFTYTAPLLSHRIMYLSRYFITLVE